MTGDVFPITKNVLKFTETDIKHDRTMKNCNHDDTQNSYYEKNKDQLQRTKEK